MALDSVREDVRAIYGAPIQPKSALAMALEVTARSRLLVACDCSQSIDRSMHVIARSRLLAACM